MIAYYFLVTVLPMVRHPLWSEFFGELTMIKYLGVVCLGYALFYLRFRSGAPRFFATWQSRFFVAFALLTIVLIVQIGTPLPWEVSPLMGVVSLLVFWVVTLIVIDSPERLRWVLLMAIGSVAYASLHVIREWQKYGGMAAGYRPGYLTGDPNYYSLSALLCVPLALYLVRTAEQPTWERWFCIGSVVLTLVGLTLAASRGGFVGVAAGTVLMAMRAQRRLRTLVLVAVAVFPLMLVAPSSPLSRIFSPNQHDIYSAEHRKELATAGLRMFREHPMTGVGPGNFKLALEYFAELGELHIAHNTYVSVMAEMGLPGIALFVAAIAATFLSLERVRRAGLSSGDDLIARAAEALEVGLVAFLAAAFFVSAETHRLFWLVVFVSMVLPELVLARAEHRGRDLAPVAATRAPTNRPLRSGGPA